MLKKLVQVYKTPILVSLTIAIVLIASNVLTEPTEIAAVLLGTFFGTFFLDLDYFIYAYFVSPESEFSKNLKAYIKHRDFKNVIAYVHDGTDAVEEKTLNSALFQVVFAGVSFFILTSNASLLIKSLAVSTFANSVYRLFDSYARGNALEWFWILKVQLKREGILLYIGVMTVILGLFIYFF